jgi:hypothetical protein
MWGAHRYHDAFFADGAVAEFVDDGYAGEGVLLKDIYSLW